MTSGDKRTGKNASPLEGRTTAIEPVAEKNQQYRRIAQQPIKYSNQNRIRGEHITAMRR